MTEDTYNTEEVQEASPTEQANQEAGEAPQSEDSNQRIIEVANPTAEEMAGISEAIVANYDSEVIVKPVMFNFKKAVDKETGLETIRKPVELAIPYPTVDGVIAMLKEGGKPLELLMEAVESVINAQARDLLYDDLTITAATMPVEKLAWAHIAAIPKAQRKGGGIPKEVWEAFEKDYIATLTVAPQADGSVKNAEQAGRAAKLLKGKLTAVRTTEPVLIMLVDQLGIYVEHSENAAEFQECVTFLLGKAESFLNVSDEDLLANL